MKLFPSDTVLEACEKIHYPDCWNTVAYPDIYSALDEIYRESSRELEMEFSCKCNSELTKGKE